jgi:hypothetical protein
MKEEKTDMGEPSEGLVVPRRGDVTCVGMTTREGH